MCDYRSDFRRDCERAAALNEAVSSRSTNTTADQHHL